MSRPRSIHAGWPLVVLLLAVSPSVGAEESHAQLRGFYPTGEFDLVLAGQKVDAELLYSKRAAAYLLAPTGRQEMFLLLQRQKQVATVTPRLIRTEMGDVDLPKAATPVAVGQFALKDGEVLIESPTLRGKLTPRAPLLGYHAKDAVLAHSPQYGLVMRAYRPERQAVERLKSATGVKVEILFGSWCARCQQTLGNALRTEQEAAANGIAYSYYGLPNPPTAWKDARFLATQTKALPTAVVYVGDKAVGRVPPAEWKAFDIALAKLLKSSR